MSDEAVQAPVDTPEPAAPQQSFDNPETSTPSQPSGNVYEAFKQLPEFKGADDYTIANTLYQSMQGYRDAQDQLRQYQQYMPETLQYLQNKSQYQQWLESQSKPAQPEQPKWWNPPQLDESWKQYIVRDPESGREVIAPDAPLEAQAAIRNYQAYTANFAKKLVTDPEGTLKPFIEQIAQQKAEELVKNQLGSYTAQTYVQSLEEQNRDWLYDQSGNVTPEGQAIQAYIQQASQLGIGTPEARWQFATGMLERDLLNMRYQQMQAAAPPEQPQPTPQPPPAEQNMQFLRERATRAPSRNGGAAEPRAPKGKMTFEERLRSQLVKDGSL